MLQNNVSAQRVIYQLSERLATVATVEELIVAVAEYPTSRGASGVVLVGVGTHEDADSPIYFNDDPTASDQPYSNVLIPLKILRNLLGFIHLTWDVPQTFTEDDQAVFAIIGRQAAWVMYGIGLHEEVQVRIQRAELLLQLSTSLSQATNEQEIVAAVAAVVDRFAPDTLLLSYLDKGKQNDSSQLALIARWTRLPETRGQFRLGKFRPLPDAFQQHISDTPPDEAILLEDVPTALSSCDMQQLERLGLSSQTAALIPLWRGYWQGFLIINWTERHVFSEEETHIYTSLIQPLAAVVASRRAYLAQEAARRESEQRARELETVSRVSAAASKNLELEQLLQTVVDLSKTSFNLYNAHIYLLDQERTNLVLTVTSGETGKEMKALGITKLLLVRDPSIAARCGRARAGIIVNDVYKSADFIPNPLLPEVRSEMAVPMLLGTTLIGVLNLQSKELNRFTSNVLLVMQALADEIAVAVRNVQLYEEQIRIAEELRTVDKLKNQFLANMSHELRTPLNAILNFTYFVSSGLFGPVNEKQVDTLGKVTHGATHLLRLINDILDFSKIEAGMMQLFWEQVDLNALLDNLIATANGLPHSEHVAIVADIDPHLPIIPGDKHRIRQIFLNLLSNALKFTEKGTVTMSAHAVDADIVFAVSDTGPGITPDDQEIIFQAFKQSVEGLSHGGTGLGLPISKHLVEAHGGRLWLSSELNVGSTFYVTLPQLGVVYDS